MTEIRWTEQAVEDLASIRSFIERDSARYGRIVAERIFEATDRLEVCQRSGRVVPEHGRESLREIVLGDYRIVYRLESEAAIILTVFHSSRLFPQSLTDS